MSANSDRLDFPHDESNDAINRDIAADGKDFVKFYEEHRKQEAQEAGDPPFKSRFKSWIRTVALIIILVFVPEQASWAFNYNPLILWGDKSRGQDVRNIVSSNPSSSEEEITSSQIALGVNRLLNKVLNNKNSQIQLQLPNRANKGQLPVSAQAEAETDQKSRSTSPILTLTPATPFTKTRIQRITRWLANPDIHPINCGVYSLRDVLISHGIEVSLEEISVVSLMVDFMNDIIRPGDPKLKTSLFAINRITEAYGLNYNSIKITNSNILRLKTPFIANFDDEHFVTVTSIDGQKVYYNDTGIADFMTREKFLQEANGFVLAVIGAQFEARMEDKTPAVNKKIAKDVNAVDERSTYVPFSFEQNKKLSASGLSDGGLREISRLEPKGQQQRTSLKRGGESLHLGPFYSPFSESIIPRSIAPVMENQIMLRARGEKPSKKVDAYPAATEIAINSPERLTTNRFRPSVQNESFSSRAVIEGSINEISDDVKMVKNRRLSDKKSTLGQSPRALSPIYEIVPEEMQAFVWGSRWHSKSDELPGLVSDKEVEEAFWNASKEATFGAIESLMQGKIEGGKLQWGNMAMNFGLNFVGSQLANSYM